MPTPSFSVQSISSTPPLHAELLSFNNNKMASCCGKIYEAIKYIAEGKNTLGTLQTIVYRASLIAIPINNLFVRGFQLNTLYINLGLNSSLHTKYISAGLSLFAMAGGIINLNVNPSTGTALANTLSLLSPLSNTIYSASRAYLWFDVLNRSVWSKALFPTQSSITFATFVTVCALFANPAPQTESTNLAPPSSIEQMWEVVKAIAGLMIPLLVLQEAFFQTTFPQVEVLKKITLLIAVAVISLYTIGGKVQPNAGNLFRIGTGQVFQTIKKYYDANPFFYIGLNTIYRFSRIMIATNAIIMPLIKLFEPNPKPLNDLTMPIARLSIATLALMYGLLEAINKYQQKICLEEEKKQQ